MTEVMTTRKVRRPPIPQLLAGELLVRPVVTKPPDHLDPFRPGHLTRPVANPAREWLDQIANSDAIRRNLLQDFPSLDGGPAWG